MTEAAPTPAAPDDTDRSFEAIARSAVAFGWVRGLRDEAEGGRLVAQWTAFERDVFAALAEGCSVASLFDRNRPVTWGRTLVALTMIAGRGLIKPGDGGAQLTNRGFAAAAHIELIEPSRAPDGTWIHPLRPVLRRERADELGLGVIAPRERRAA